MESKRSHFRAIIIFTLASATGIIAQLIAVCGFIDIFFDNSIVFVASTYVTGAVAGAAGFTVLQHKGRKLFFMLALLLSLVYPVGGLIAAYTIFFCKYLIPAKDSTSMHEDILIETELYENTEVDDYTAPVSEEDFIRDSLDIESFSDIMHSDNVFLKRSVIEKLSRKDTREAVLLISDALKDDDIEIRFYASSALKKIEENFQSRILALKEKINQMPDSAETNLRLSIEYFKFCRSGLLDQTSRHFYLERADRAIRQALAQTDDNIDVLLQAGKVLLDMGNAEEALLFFDNAHNLDQNNWQILIWRCEAYFRIQQFDRIKEDCERIEQLNSPWDSVRNITKYWLEYA